jgi:hypothetical protein
MTVDCGKIQMDVGNGARTVFNGLRPAAGLLALALALPGCVATGQQHIDKGEAALTAATKISRSPSELQFAEFRLGELQKFDWAESASVMEEGGKRRFVKGFVIQQDKKPLSLRIGSYRAGTIQDPAIFYPEVRVLDSEFRLVRAIPAEEFAYRSTVNGSGLFATVFFNAQQADEKYVLVTNRERSEQALKTAQDNITSSTVVGIPIGTAIVFWNIPTGVSSPPVKMRAAPSGNIEIMAEEYKLMSAVAK